MKQMRLPSGEEKTKLKQESKHWKSWTLTARQLCDLELLLNGGFAPLKGFLGKEDYESVCQEMRLKSGDLWPIPIVLDVKNEFADQIQLTENIALRDEEGVMLAILKVQEKWEPDRVKEAKRVYGTESTEHPGVAYLLEKTNPIYLSGELEGTELPHHYDFKNLRHTPQELKEEFANLGWDKIIAFQTRNPMHRAHFEMTLRALKEHQVKLLVHPVVGMTKPGDVDYFTRVRCYRALLPKYPESSAKLSLLPLAMRMAGPREVLLHAIIRKNYGCTHFIVGRDHAGPGKDSQGKDFYGPYEAQEALKKHEDELKIKMVAFQMMSYVEELDQYFVADELPENAAPKSISGTQLREKLKMGAPIPEWFTFPEVAQELAQEFPPRLKQGFTVFFTGLPSSGKSTLANVLQNRLLEIGGRSVSILDGDIVRQMLSSELTFSKEHRDLNIRRIGYVAAEITKSGGIAICAPIAPYNKVRGEVQEMVQTFGGFILVHVATPLEICEERDRKGLYLKAREGIIKEFTGISDPYEIPENANLSIDTSLFSPEEATNKVIEYLEQEGFIAL